MVGQSVGGLFSFHRSEDRASITHIRVLSQPIISKISKVALGSSEYHAISYTYKVFKKREKRKCSRIKYFNVPDVREKSSESF